MCLLFIKSYLCYFSVTLNKESCSTVTPSPDQSATLLMFETKDEVAVQVIELVVCWCQWVEPPESVGGVNIMINKTQQCKTTLTMFVKKLRTGATQPIGVNYCGTQRWAQSQLFKASFPRGRSRFTSMCSLSEVNQSWGSSHVQCLIFEEQRKNTRAKKRKKRKHDRSSGAFSKFCNLIGSKSLSFLDYLRWSCDLKDQQQLLLLLLLLPPPVASPIHVLVHSQGESSLPPPISTSTSL